MAANTAPTFMIGDGIVVTPMGARASTMTLAPDGRILLGGGPSPNGRYAINRYNPDGTLDTTFDGDGKVNPQVPGGVQDIAVQADGKVVAAVQDSSFGGVLVRLNENGTFDTTFSGDGRVSVGGFDQHVEVQQDGRIIFAGSLVQRYNSDGTLDTTFGSNGSIQDGRPFSTINALTLQADGKIVIAGETSMGEVIRYNADGTRDTTFDGDGRVSIADFASSDINDAFVQADGKIVLVGDVGSGPEQMLVIRLNADGSLDTTFDGDGRVVVPGTGRAFDGTQLPDGRILLTGDGFTVVRLNANGSLDTTFDGDGKASVQVPNAFGQIARGLAVLPDDRIIVGGYAGISTDHFVLARFNADGTLDLSFEGANTLNGAPTYKGDEIPVVLDGDARVYDAQLASQGHYAGASVTLQRHGGADADDVFTGVGALGALVQGFALNYAGANVGTVTTNSNGVLTLTFNSNATQARVNGVLQAIAYANTTETSTTAVQIDWTFSDGNTSGAQGTGGALAALGSTTVYVFPDGVVTWSFLANGQVVRPFDPETQVLRFDSTAISAARVAVSAGAGGATTIFSFSGKTVTLDMPLAAVTTTNVIFDNGSRLIVGDNTTGGGNDGSGNVLAGGAFNDHLLGLGGDDVLIGGAGGDRLDGGSDQDTAQYDTAPGGIVASLHAPAMNTGHAAGDGYLSIESLVGSSFDDTLAGDNLANGLKGLGGDDYLQGRGGNDALDGGDGNDELDGNLGADSLAGGAGHDYAKYKYAAAAVAVDLATPGLNTGEAAGDTFTSMEGVIGSAYGDQLYGNAVANDLAGLDGNDTLFGRPGDDNLQGMNGDDVIDGGSGGDRLVGGAGNDTFILSRGEANGDGIVDFAGNGAAAGDRLVFQRYGAGATFTQIDATHWSINPTSGPAEVITIANGAAIHASDYTFI